MLLSPKYAWARRTTFLIWVFGAVLLLVFIWGALVAEAARAELARAGAQQWLAASMARAESFQKVGVVTTYLQRAVIPVLSRAIRTRLWLLGLMQGLWMVLAIAGYPRVKQWADRRREQPASGRWATTGEVLRHFTPTPGEITAALGLLRPEGRWERGIARLRGVQEYLLEVPYSTLAMGLLVVGGTGAGKTWGVMIPQILSLARQQGVSVIAVDIKFGERDCLSMGSRVWARHGPVVAWNPWDPDSIRIDVMAGLDTEGDVRDQIAILMGHAPTQAAEDIQFWSSNESAVLDVLLNGAKAEGRNMDRVRELSYLMPEGLQKYVAQLPSVELRRKLDRFWGVSYDKQAGTLQGLEKYLTDWDDPNVVRATTPGSPEETFDLRRILREHVLFTVAIPQEKFVSGHALLMFRLIIRMLTKMLLSPRAPDEQQRVVLILEEFPQLEKIPYFSRFLATCRSRGVATVVTAQGMHQGYGEYGRDTFTGLLNNFRTRVVFFSSLSPEEAAYFSGYTGERTMDKFSWGASPSGRRLGVSEGTRALAPLEEMHWKWGPHEAAVHTQGIPDFRLQCPPAVLRPPFVDWLAEALGRTPQVDPDGRVDLPPPTMRELMAGYKRAMGERAFYEALAALEARAEGSPNGAAAPEPAVPEPPAPGLATIEPSAAEHALPASTDLERPAAPSEGTPLAGPTAAALVNQVATMLLELEASDRQSVVAVEVKSTKKGMVSTITLPRGLLEEIYGVEAFGRYLKVWMEYGWLAPRPGDRLELQRPVCQMLEQQLARRLLSAFLYRRRGHEPGEGTVVPKQAPAAAPSSPQMPDLTVAKPPSAETSATAEAHDYAAAADRLRELCRWVEANAAHFEGYPQRDPARELYGLVTSGSRVVVIPMYARRVQRMGQREAWELWAAWRTAGWTEVSEADRLTTVVRVNGKTVRAISIRWAVYQAAVAGQPLVPGGQLQLVAR